MIVFLSWLVANMEIVFIFFLSIITIVKINSSDMDGGIMWVMALIIYYIFALISSAKSWLGSLFMALLTTFFSLALYVDNQSMFWTAITTSLIVAVIIAIFTAIHKETVISRRMLYVNSNVAMFEFTLLYVLNRFFTAYTWMMATMLFYAYFDSFVNSLIGSNN